MADDLFGRFVGIGHLMSVSGGADRLGIHVGPLATPLRNRGDLFTEPPATCGGVSGPALEDARRRCTGPVKNALDLLLKKIEGVL